VTNLSKVNFFIKTKGTNEDTGVGAAIAAGSQAENGI
jgi:hypothetical protein